MKKVTRKDLRKEINKIILEAVSDNESNIGEHPPNQKIGNAFRAWVNYKYPAYAKEISLGPSGSFNNSYIKKAWMKYGNEFVKRINNDNLELLNKKSSVSKESINEMLSEISEFKDIEIEIMSGLSENIVPAVINALPELTQGKEVVLGKGSSKISPNSETLKWCAEWVNSQTKRSGSAWHNWSNADKNGFLEISNDEKNILGLVFTKMNKAYPKIQTYSKSSEINKALKAVAQNHILKPADILKIPVGSIIGMYHGKTSFFPRAFWENATGHTWTGAEMGGPIAGGTDKFVEVQTGQKWTIDDLGSNKEFKLNDKYSGVVFNSHIGVIGAKIDGRLIAFHNIDGQIYMTPSKKLITGQDGDAIMWYEKPAKESAPRPNKAYKWVMSLASKLEIENSEISTSTAKFVADSYDSYKNS